ncbi:MAG: BLUF domain-containing protein [Rhodobacteraceae bacterium]|nr:BLUF domain-containing protein [Paracoccaceae bacterium]
MALHRLIYCSRARNLDETAIRQILDACERNNPKDYISGMLLFTSDFFVQLLEGSRSAISQRFLKIAIDPRHADVEILSSNVSDVRIFDRWSMHYVAVASASDASLRRFSSNGTFDPYRMTPSAIEQLCIDRSVQAAQEMLK